MPPRLALAHLTFLACLLLLPTAYADMAQARQFYQQGKFATALDAFQAEAEQQNNPEAQRLLGLMYLNGQGSETNMELAVYWLNLSARQGDVQALGLLAELYFTGQGLPQDDISAVYKAQQAAWQGYAPAQVILGKLYLEGRGIAPDLNLAVQSFRDAAGQGHPEGQYQLAQRLERGEGTAQDRAQALDWYSKAAAQGYRAAVEAVQRLGAGALASAAPVPSPVAVPAISQPAVPLGTVSSGTGPQMPTTSQAVQTTTQKRRVALLLANQDYQNHDLDLVNPVNDTKLLEASLLRAGFAVTIKTNLGLRDMNQELSRFLAGVHSDTVSLVYYSGHGVEIDGRNYLIPTDFQMSSTLTSSEAKHLSVDIASFYSQMTAEAEGSLNIVILDACRNNPFRVRGIRGISDGLGGVKALGIPDSDGTIETFTAYAASSGQVAQDGLQNSPYAKALAGQIGVPGQELDVTFRKVRDVVATLTSKQQIPTTAAGRSSEFFFTPGK